MCTGLSYVHKTGIFLFVHPRPQIWGRPLGGCNFHVLFSDQSSHSPRKKRVYRSLGKESDLRTLAHRKGLRVFSLSLKCDLFFFFFFFLWTRGGNKSDLFNICLCLVLRLFTEELASFNSDVMSPFFRKQVSKQAENPIFKQLKST